MFKFVTLAIVAMADVEAAHIRSKNYLKAKAEAKAFVNAYEQLAVTMNEMEKSGELENGNFDLGGLFKQGMDAVKGLFH